MKWLVLLVLAGLAKATNRDLGDRIFATEQECGRLYSLNENWSTRNFHEQAAQYVDLYFICVDSLNEDKYAYIDENEVDLNFYPGNDTFPIETSQGEKYVKKPPQRKAKDEETMKKRLSEYLRKTGGMINPIYRLMSAQSEMGQDIVDKQIECEALALLFLKHPEDKENEPQHNECVNMLNCLKEKFMAQHMFTRKQYPDFFPILYKRRGTMIKTPPKLEKSACENPGAEGGKRELEKWMSGIEYIGEKLTNFGEAGTDFIQKLVKKGMGGGEKVLNKDDLDNLLDGAESVTIRDDDGEDDDENTHKVYSDVMLGKLAELEAKGVKIAHSQLDKAKPTFEKVQSMASQTGEKIKKLPVVEKTAQSLTKENLKEVGKSALGSGMKGMKVGLNVAGEGMKVGLNVAGEGMKAGLNVAGEGMKVGLNAAGQGMKVGLNAAGGVAKKASLAGLAKAKEEGSVLIQKLKSHGNAEVQAEATEESLRDIIPEEYQHDMTGEPDKNQVVLGALIDQMVNPEYLPDDYTETTAPSLLEVLKDMGGHYENGKDKISDEELEKTLQSLKESTKQKAADLNLTKESVQRSAEVVKGVMHTLLNAASHGYGSAKDMSPEEIDKAKSLVNKLVDYATDEIVNKDITTGGDGDVEEDSSSDESGAENDVIDLTQDSEMTTATTDKAVSENINTKPIVNQTSNQPTPLTQNKSDISKVVEKKNEEAIIIPGKVRELKI